MHRAQSSHNEAIMSVSEIELFELCDREAVKMVMADVIDDDRIMTTGKGDNYDSRVYGVKTGSYRRDSMFMNWKKTCVSQAMQIFCNIHQHQVSYFNDWSTRRG
ncbi:hypothetical protein DPMN_020418 [Dreissena polymorpha]|uniref:Uncharacterized protein n=1 Tax=Dreissena polymorpha TaxID=45954 RepID=A0A9D4NM39_DREPO|nr:hypothetical protein DPMN_020418 [Dreissena polymorpha]